MPNFYNFFKLILISTIAAIISAFILYYSVSAYVISEAKESVQNLLLSQRGLHHYIQRVMHPAFYRARDAGYIDTDFYNPEIFSSSFMVRSQHKFYNEERQKVGLPEVYYKLAASNPRNPINKADTLELELLNRFNENRAMKEFEKIVKLNGKKFLYYAIPFLETKQRCLKCHGKREDAPLGLQEKYPQGGGFGVKVGQFRAIESIRIPIENKLYTIYIVSGSLSVGILALIILIIFNTKLRHLVKVKTTHLKTVITKNNKTKKSLHLSEERYRELIEGTNDLITQVDGNGNFLFVNHMSEKFFGLPPEDILGKSAFAFIHPEDRKDTENLFLEYIRIKAIDGIFENRQLNHLTGDVFYVLWTSKLQYDAQGNLTQVNSIARDITFRKQAENDLIRERKTARKYLDVAGVMLTALDAEGKVTMINRKGCEILGYEHDEIIGKNWFENFLPHNVSNDTRLVFNKLMSGDMDLMQYHENNILAKGNTEKLIAFNSTILQEQDNNINGILFSGEDITLRKQAQEQVRTSLKEKEVLLAEIHHRVKNNMAIISSLLSLQTNSVKDEKTIMVLKESQNRIRSMALIHEQLYQHDNLSSIDFRSYVEILQRGIMHSLDFKSVNTVLKTDIEDIDLDMDTLIPCGLIMNELITNAYKYAFKDVDNPEIRVALHRTLDDRIVLAIADNGTGLPKDINLDKIDTLGLRIVKQLSNQLDGTIIINRDNGTEFLIKF